MWLDVGARSHPGEPGGCQMRDLRQRGGRVRLGGEIQVCGMPAAVRCRAACGPGWHARHTRASPYLILRSIGGSNPSSISVRCAAAPSARTGHCCASSSPRTPAAICRAMRYGVAAVATCSVMSTEDDHLVIAAYPLLEVSISESMCCISGNQAARPTRGWGARWPAHRRAIAAGHASF